DLSSDESEAEQTSDDNKASASQSKKGKVIGPSGGGGAPVKKPQSPSSSSNSSSESSSDSEGNEDEDKEKSSSPQAKGKRMPKSASSNSSNSSSESESESSSNGEDECHDDDDDDDDEENEDSIKTSKEEAQVSVRGEKTPSPPQNKNGGPASVGTPGSIAQEGAESSMSWGLQHFMQSSKNNSNSPANHSPLKSPNSVHSGPPSVRNKDDSIAQTPDSSRSRSLKDIGPSATMPFDPGVTTDHAVDSDDNQTDKKNKANESDNSDNCEDDDDSDSDDEDDNRVRKKKKRKKLVSHKEVGAKLPSLSPISHATSKQSGSISGEKSESKTHKSLGKGRDPAQKPADLKVSSTALPSSEKVRRQHSSSYVAKSKAVTPVKGTESSHKRKKSTSKTGSLSDVEIDVVSVTPDVKSRQRLSPGTEEDASEDRRKQEASKRLFEDEPSDSSEESDSKLSASRGKNIHIHDSKRHRRKHSPSGSPSLTSSLPPNFHTAQTTAEKIPKKLSSDSDALEHLRSMAKPPNLLSPISSVFPSPPGAFSSKEKLPSFEKSFSPAPHPGGSASLESSSLLSSPRPSIIISKQNHDGTSQPQIKVQVPIWCLPEHSLTWLREKKRKSRKSNSSSADVEKTKEEFPSREKSPQKPSFPTSSSGQPHDHKNSRVPPIPDPKLSSPSSGKQGSASNDIPQQKSLTSTSSDSASAQKPEKRKVSDSNGVGHSAPSNLSSTSQYKIPKTSKTSKRESSQGSSNQSPASGSSEKSSKSNKQHSASPDRSKTAGSSSAVKTLDFANKSQDHSVVANGTPSSTPTSSLGSDSKQSKSSKRKASSKDEVPNKKNKTE
ncbi:hypothetical protein EGW08_004020, partial [Elysia chlorotica]